ncbi:MAG: hypothetical protein KC609_03570 [Myxococcales bacterium]|nr:hypothetical protein [Myxococcales bacterium]
MRRTVIAIAATLVATTASSAPAWALAEACARQEVCTTNRGPLAVLRFMVCVPLVAFCSIGDLVTGPVYSTDGQVHFVGFEKEFDVSLSGTRDRRENWRIGHNVFFTPSVLFGASERDLIVKLRGGYHLEVLFARPRRDGSGVAGLSSGAGISAGYRRQFGAFFGGGPDLKLFYQFFPHSRFVVGARTEYTTLQLWQVDAYVGVALRFR